MLHVVGEILVDIYKDNQREQIFPGGAPFNIAYNVAHFGGNVSFYGVVGKDEYGKFLKKFARQTFIYPLVIKSLSSRNTTQAIVSLNNSERTFRFNRNNGADYVYNIRNLEKLAIEKNDIFHIGSLMLSSSRGKRFFYKAVEYAKNKEALISFDVNYRDDIFETKNQAIRAFKKAVKYADILKVSDEELKVLTHLKRIEPAVRKLFRTNQLVFITLGSKGSCVYKDGFFTYKESISISPVDTTGAGDAFYSSILFDLDNNINLLKDELLVESMLKKANIVGAIVTQRKGAIGVAPNQREMNEFLNSYNYVIN